MGWNKIKRRLVKFLYILFKEFGNFLSEYEKNPEAFFEVKAITELFKKYE
jgi:hypothetical protein